MTTPAWEQKKTRKRASGECFACARPAAEGRTLCDGHAAKRREEMRGYYRDNAEAIAERARTVHKEARFASSLRKYNLTPDDYRAMLTYQQGGCAICKKPETYVQKGTVRRLAVDHCHESGTVRGLLCHRCNRVLGLLDDDADLIRTAAEYIEVNHGR